MGLMSKWFGKTSQEDFAKVMMQAIKEAGISDTNRYNDADFSLNLGEHDFFYLANAYKDYCEAPREMRSNVVENYLSSIRETTEKIPEQFEVGIESYFPHLRNRSFIRPLFGHILHAVKR